MPSAMKQILCLLDCTIWAVPVGLGASYLLLPAAEDRLRYGMLAYTAVISLGPHWIFRLVNRKGALHGVAAFLAGQLFHFLSLFACAAFLYISDAIYESSWLVPGLLLFLVYIGAFLFFQLASATGGPFCGLQD